MSRIFGSAFLHNAPSWTLDITPFVTAGDNLVKVIVYNTLSNHYSTILTKYNRQIESGLLGPVKLIYSKIQGKKENVQ